MNVEATDLPHDARATREKLDYAIEVRREAVLSMLSRERHALAASLLGLAVMTVSVAALPVRGLLGWFLALRLIAFVFTRWAASRLETRIKHGGLQKLDIIQLALCHSLRGNGE